MSGLPKGWVEVELGEIVSPRGEKADPATLGEMPFIGMDHVEAETSRLLGTQPVSELKSAVSIFKKGDILYGRMRPYLNKVHEAQFDGAASAEFIIIPPSKVIVQQLLAMLLRHQNFVQLAVQRSTGDRPRVKFQSVADYTVSLPPLVEQRRIVAKLDSLFARITRARAELNRISLLVERYKQAVLFSAFSGNLTKNWRSKRLFIDTPCHFYSQYLGKQKENGDWFYPIPQSWSWEEFDKIYKDVTDSRKKIKQKEYLDQGLLPIIDQGERFIGGYTNDLSLAHPMSPPFIIFGDHTRCIKYVEERFVQGADGVKVLKSRSDVLPKFSFWVLRAIEIPNKGYSRHMKFLKASFFPLPSLEEQKEIVRRIEKAFTAMDAVAQQTAAALRQLAHLEAQCLNKAFRGELVPQDPSDEPASALLDRIRAARVTTPQPRRRQRNATG